VDAMHADLQLCQDTIELVQGELDDIEGRLRQPADDAPLQRQSSMSIEDALGQLETLLVSMQVGRLDNVSGLDEQGKAQRRELNSRVEATLARIASSKLAVQVNCPLDRLAQTPRVAGPGAAAPEPTRRPSVTEAEDHGAPIQRRPSQVVLLPDMGTENGPEGEVPVRGADEGPVLGAEDKPRDREAQSEGKGDKAEQVATLGTRVAEPRSLGEEPDQKRLKEDEGTEGAHGDWKPGDAELRDKAKEGRTVVDADLSAQHVAVAAAAAAAAKCRLFSWGQSADGQLFHPDDQPHHPHEPVDFGGKHAATVAFAAAPTHSILVTSTGELRACGLNKDGAVVPGDESTTLLKPRLVEPLLSHRIVSVACGWTHTACLTDRGKVLTFGSNSFGALGHGLSDQDRTQVPPRSVPALAAYDVVQVVCGAYFTIALTSTAAVYSWGMARCTGHPRSSSSTTTNFTSAQRVQAFVGITVQRLAAGAHHSIATTLAGDAYVWGENYFHQLGPRFEGEGDLVLAPRRLKSQALGRASGTPLIYAACGDAHSLLVDEDGGVWACGKNTHGELGLPDAGDQVEDPQRVESLRRKGLKVQQAACGLAHSLVLCTDGTVLATGASDYGQCLGPTGPQAQLEAFTAVPFGQATEGVMLIAAGGHQSMALAKNAQPPAPLSSQEAVASEEKNELSQSVPELERSEGQALRRDFSTRISFVDPQASEHLRGSSAVAAAETPLSSACVFPSIHRSRLGTALDHVCEAPSKSDGSDEDSAARTLVATLQRAFDSSAILSGVALLQARPEGMAAELLGHDKDRRSWTVALDFVGMDELYKRILRTIGSTPAAAATAAANAPSTPGMAETPKLARSLLSELLASVGRCVEDLFEDGRVCSSEPDAIRAVLALWQCPLLSSSGPKIRHVLASLVRGMDRSFATAATAKRKTFLQAIVADTAGYPEIFFTRLVQPLRSLAATELNRHQLRQSETFKATVRMLNLLFTVNEWYATRLHEPIIPASQFTVDAVSELPVSEQQALGLLYRDFESFKAHATRSQSQLCRFAFLLRPDTKRELLRVEAQLQQNYAGMQAVAQSVTSQVLNPAARFLVLHVNREHLLQHTLTQLVSVPDTELRKELKVAFEGEDGIDEGGVRKEFFQLLIERLFSEQYGMFTRVGGSLWFNQGCTWSDGEYSLVGMLIGLALYNGVILDVHFPLVVYKKLLPDQRWTLRDVAFLDPELARGLRQLLEFEPAGLVEDTFCRSFEVTWTSFGADHVTELKPGGSEILITGENRKEYVELYVRWLLEQSVEQQFGAFKQGFDRVMGSATLGLLRPEDLEAIVSGTPHLDFKELRRVTVYEGGYHDHHPVMEWFWDVVESMDLDTQRKLLMFATGSVKAPIGGLKNLTFKVHRMGPDSEQLPTSHTCFNTMLIPEYSSQAKLNKLVRLAVSECEGFGLK